jgi:alpha,alpha-trehalose phosphorylase
MLNREIHHPPEHIYPPDEWRIVERRWPGEYRGRAETAFSLSNGYLGVRGTFEEGRPALSPGTFVNGFHETWPIEYAEEAHGLARTGQTIVAVPDATILKLYVDDEPLVLDVANLRRYERVYDMRNGVLTRDLLWSTPSGKHVAIRSARLVSFEHRHIMAMSYEVTLLGCAAPVVVASHVVNRHDSVLPDERSNHRAGDPRLAKRFDHRVLEPLIERDDGERMLFGYRTANSHMTLAVAVQHRFDVEDPHEISRAVEADNGEVVLSVDAEPDHPIRIEKFVAYQTSRSVPAEELVDRARRTVLRVAGDGFGQLEVSQREHLDRFWGRADVEVTADENSVRLQQAVRWNLFQLAQASWRAEGAGIPAKGLTGQAYEGQYFWDSEIFVLPFMTYTQPRIARNLLRFRRSMLDTARERARTLNQRGALFPWRTINGEEASASYQSGTAQYHINADIAYAVDRYVRVRGDVGFLAEAGAEILVETARLWEDLGFYREDDRFSIHGVTGPDEYTTVVNDNAYTNLMARANLRSAVSAIRTLADERPDDLAALVDELHLADDEIARWERAAEHMYVPYDEERGVHPQDESFLDRERWDLEGTPRDRFPLLLHYHPLVIYRHRVIKQADVVLAMFLLGDEFSVEQKRRNFEYYDPLTTGDSSLSAAVQSIVAAEIGDDAAAMEYFRYALLMDLADLAGNVSDGVHIAAAGGVWLSLVFGFGGVRDHGGRLSFTPHLPSNWEKMRFSVRFRDRQIRVDLDHRRSRYLLEEGEPLEVTIDEVPRELSPGHPLDVEVA